MPTPVRLRGYVGEFRLDTVPAVPTPPDIDLSTLEDGDGAPFFVTLPIIPEIGAVSGNGVLYDDELAAAIEMQVNAKRPGANFGHLAEDDRGTAFPHPSAFWVGALRIGETLWAKCYVPAGVAREHLKNLRAVGGRISTSIFGQANYEQVKKGVQRLVDFELETIDFAPPERSALGYAAPVVVTAEMSNQQEVDMAGQEQVTEMAQVSEQLREQLRTQIIAEYEKETGAQRTIAELTQTRDAAVTELANVREQLRLRQVAEVRRTVKDRVSELTEWRVQNPDAVPELKALRALVSEFAQERLGERVDVVEAQRIVDAAWVQFKPLAESVRSKLAGPPAVVAGRVQEMGGFKPVEDTPEARNKALARMGLNV